MRMYEPPKQGDLREIKIELTRNCPLACIHCSSEGYPGNSAALTKEAVLSIVDEAADLAVASIVFSGGEPLLWPWIP